MLRMQATPVRLYYRGWAVVATPHRFAGGWSAIVEVWQGSERTPVPFSGLYKTREEASGTGLTSGQRWIDEANAQRQLRLMRQR